MEIDYDYLRTGTAIGFHASHELCSNYLLIYLLVLKLTVVQVVALLFTEECSVLTSLLICSFGV